MQHQTNYNQIIQSIDNLKYSDKKRLYNHLKKVIDSDHKTKSSKNGKSISWLGCLADQTEIRGDIIAPVIEETEWKVLSE